MSSISYAAPAVAIAPLPYAGQAAAGSPVTASPPGPPTPAAGAGGTFLAQAVQAIGSLFSSLWSALAHLFGGGSSAGPAPKSSALPPARPPASAPARLPDPASFYLTQTRTSYNGGGSVNANCGPTSLAMAAVAFGKLKMPSASDGKAREALVEQVRGTMTGQDDIHAGTSTGQILAGAKKLGLSSSYGFAPDLKALDSALTSGKLVVAQGNPGAYGAHPGGHFILVVARAADGGYVVNDPVYLGARPAAPLTAAQMRGFLGYGIAVGT